MDFEAQYITEKHYHRGYVQGVFDLFHIGHLNLLRRAKACCDYLIVGVVADDIVKSYKNKMPYIPLDERMAIVRAVRYVDEVVAVDRHNFDKLKAWELYHFDCHFSGDDHTAEWTELERKFRELGVDMVNFPYTEKRSSTMLRRVIANSEPGKGAGEDKKYQAGYIMLGSGNCLPAGDYEVLKDAASCCGRLTVGIPGDDLAGRMRGTPSPADFARRKEIISQLRFVHEVVEVNWNNVSRIDMWEQVRYDVCFTGSMYGRQFYEDREALRDRGADLILLNAGDWKNDVSVMEEAVRDASHTKQTVLFGTGAYFDSYMDTVGRRYKPAFAVDNDSSKWGTKKAGVMIYPPDKLKEFPEDGLLVVLCCRKYGAVLEQLRCMGNYDFRIMSCRPEIALWSEYELILRSEKEYLKESHRQLKILLKEFDRVCTEYGLKYYLICGALIGAVRHKDLIPWDDDADVAMTRTDYEELKKHAAEIWDGHDFTFLPYDGLGNGTFLDFMNRLVYQKERIPTNIFYRVKDRMKADVCDHQVLDIYVLDDASDDDGKHRRHCFRQKILYGLAMGHRGKTDMSLYKAVPPFIRTAVWFLSHAGRLIPLSLIFRMYERHCRKFSGLNTRCYYESNGWINFFSHRIPKELLAGTCRLPVGDLSVSAPERYGDFLEDLGYHSFMSFPPACTRKPTHSVKSELIL